MNLDKALYHYFGYSSFREGQKEVITDILKKKDVFVTLPTGAGKSICYLLPGYVMEGKVVIVSPLLSLMEDQVQQLKEAGEKNAIALNSFLKYDEKRNALANLSSYRFVFLSPEALQIPNVIKALQKGKTSLFVVDEAHCISQWGHEFRTDYLKLNDVRKALNSPPCLALTATASKEVQSDILKALHMESAALHIHSIDRPNIVIEVEKVESVDDKLSKILYYIKSIRGPAIIYCPTRNWTENLASFLKENGHSHVAAYHAGLTTEDRMLIQQQFIHDQLDVICATNAFGMGINKPNIHLIIHFHYPSRIESYLQEIGRAGRNGEKSVAVLLFSDQDHDLPKSIIQSEYPDEYEVDKTLMFLTDLYQSGNQLSFEVDSYVIQTLQLTEVKWRLLKFLLETYDVINNNHISPFSLQDIKDEILNYCSHRITYKTGKLYEMVNWINTEGCRREGYLKLFNETLKRKPDNCCDKCGWDKEEYTITALAEVNSFTSWEMELKKIFHLE